MSIQENGKLVRGGMVLRQQKMLKYDTPIVPLKIMQKYTGLTALWMMSF